MENIDTSLIAAHWPFLVVALCLGITGEVVKRLVIPKENPKVLTGWRGVFRVTLPLHPAVVGLLLGLMPFMPCPDVVCDTITDRALYYMAAGMLSSYVYAALKHVFKERVGVDAP